MGVPSSTEQYLLELINEARLDPMGNAARYLTSFNPPTSQIPALNAMLGGVNGAALLAIFQALTPAKPLAWNSAINDATLAHTNLMIANGAISHQFPGEAAFFTRMAVAGYTGAALGENIANGPSVLWAHGAFMVDPNPGSPNGILPSPNHRDNIMNANAREIGISAISSGGSVWITEDFGNGGSPLVFLGVAYNDSDQDNFYSVGEGLATLNIAIAGGGTTTSTASGGYTLGVSSAGAKTVTFTGGGLASAVTVTGTFATNLNVKIDIVNGAKLRTSESVTVSGPITQIEGIGVTGLTLTGGAGGQSIKGTAGTDVLSGLDGDDTLIGGAAAANQTNALLGGNGSDTASYVGTTGIVYANIAAGGAFVANVLTDVYSSIENIIGGSGADTLVGDGNGNRIDGGAGAADDLLFGNDGADTLVGGGHAAGSFNQLFGGNGSDTVDYSAETGKIFVDLRAPAGHIDNGAGFVLNDLMNSVENAIGGSNDDTLIGTDADNNFIDGRAGTDVLFGFGGDDTLAGGTARAGQFNQLFGGAGNDTASYSWATTRVYADLNVFAGFVDNGGGTLILNDVYNLIENLIGGTGNDSLVGDSGANTLTGGAGADILYGNTGVGFDGSIDTFVYTAQSDSNLTTGYDTISNFKTGQDKLDLTAFHINASAITIASGGGSTSLYANVTGGQLAMVFVGANAVAVGDILF